MVEHHFSFRKSVDQIAQSQADMLQRNADEINLVEWRFSKLSLFSKPISRQPIRSQTKPIKYFEVHQKC